jgi:D-alanyl-lipoteichoic acid acyltransferase DltB (MBOAT superfamily)
MLFNSGEFLLFFPIVVLIYFVIPAKVRYIWLLLSSYYFYMGWNAKYALLLLFSTAVTFFSGLLIEKANTVRAKKTVVAASFILNLSVLFFYKYINFSLSLLGGVVSAFGGSLSVPTFDIILPVGISFFTFQALSYTMDIYRGEIYAEHNFLRYALYVSFFPQLVAGPIERSKNLLKQLAVPTKFDYEKAKNGLFLMLWGYFLKLVLADRIAIVVDTVYNSPSDYEGWYCIIATVLFALQIYCDFAGYSTIAVGAAKILGINLMENFDAPYLSLTVAEFWRKWHISLTSWFRDYLYIPLGGNRKGKIRKDINIMIVFLLSGLWHGAGLHYVVWGGLNGLYQVIGGWLKPIREKLCVVTNVRIDSFGHKIFKALVTFVLVDLAWVFFRANTLKDAATIISAMLHTQNHWVLFDSSLYGLGLDQKEFTLMIVSIAILGLVDIAKHYGVCIREAILKQDYLVRLVCFVICVSFILMFGIWGPGYSSANFIYFQF